MPVSRRRFLLDTAVLASATLLPKVVFAESVPEGTKLLGEDPLHWFSADQLPDYFTVLTSNPLNAYPPVHLLNPDITPADVMFVRNNGIMPDFGVIDPKTWTLTIDGESAKTSKTYTLAELKKRFANKTYQLTIECGGNGRRGFYPTASGYQWTRTAVGCSQWHGVSLRDVLEDCGVQDDAVYVGFHGADKHLSGSGAAISRGLPIAAAMEEHTLLAWSMNGEDIPYLHGYPLRLVAGGRPGSVSGKWITGLSIRDRVHDGEKMEAPSYSVPKYPVAPGAEVPQEDFEIIDSMIVDSLITNPQSGLILYAGKPLRVRGHAWAGVRKVDEMALSIDFGRTWQEAALSQPVNFSAWQHFEGTVMLPEKGYYEVWARATDEQGVTQPMVQSNWNPKGYLFNACHRIAVQVV